VEEAGKPRIMVVIPALNEEGKIGWVVRGIVKHRSSLVDLVVVVIDNGTIDNTAKEAKEAGAIVLYNGAKRGVGAAIRRGIQYGLERNMQICMIMAGDAQDDPREIPKLLHPLLHEGFDFAQGSRYLNGQRTVNMPLSRAILTRLFTLGFRLITGFLSTDATNGFRAFRMNVLRDIDIWQESLDKYALENYLLTQVVKRGFRVKEVEVTKRFNRELGYSHMRVLIDNSFWAVVKAWLE